MARLQSSLIQIQGISAAAGQIKETLGPEWPVFEKAMLAMLVKIATADYDDIRRVVDDLMYMGLHSPASKIFREIGQKSRAGESLRWGSDELDGVVSAEDTDEELREVTRLLIREMGGVIEKEEASTSEEETASYPHFAFKDISRPLRSRELHIHEGFKVYRKYRLTVSIEMSPDLRFGGSGSPEPIERPAEAAEETIEINVAVFPNGVLSVPKPLADLKWPARGPSFDNAEFEIEVADEGRESNPILDVFFYYNTNILYWARLNISVRLEDHVWEEEKPAITWRYMEDKDESRSLLFQNFSDIKNLHERGLSLAIHPAEVRDTYLLTAFIGRAQYPARVMLSRAQLTGNLVKMRSLMDNLRRELAYFEGGYNAAGKYIGDFSNEPFNFTITREKAPSPREVYKRFIQEMANQGSKFWNSLFSGSSSGRKLREIIVAELKDGDIIQIYLGKGAHDFIYPWNWLYTEISLDPYYKTNIRKEKFWGYRFIIEQLYEFPEKILTHIPVDELKIKIGVANIEPTTRIQKEYFASLNAKGNGLPVYEIWDSDKPWQEFLQNCDSQILYYYSHGHTANPATLTGEQFYDWLPAWKEFVEGLPEDDKMAKQRKKKVKENLEELTDRRKLLDRSYIKLRHGYLLVEDLQNLMVLDQSNPLVFLNMCESAQVFPHLSGGLIDTFLNKGARGVIGTEIPMPPAFADLFSREFFEAFFIQEVEAKTPESIGQILLNLRQKYLDMNNPFGFAYTYFGDVTTRMSRSLTA